MRFGKGSGMKFLEFDNKGVKNQLFPIFDHRLPVFDNFRMFFLKRQIIGTFGKDFAIFQLKKRQNHQNQTFKMFHEPPMSREETEVQNYIKT